MADPAPQQFKVLHQGDVIGVTFFEGGDPDTGGVSGAIHNMAGARALAEWIKSIGGSEDEGAVYVELGEDFSITDAEGSPVAYGEATLISVPDEDEAYIDVTGVPEKTYHALFMHHVEAATDG